MPLTMDIAHPYPEGQGGPNFPFLPTPLRCRIPLSISTKPKEVGKMRFKKMQSLGFGWSETGKCQIFSPTVCYKKEAAGGAVAQQEPQAASVVSSTYAYSIV